MGKNKNGKEGGQEGSSLEAKKVYVDDIGFTHGIGSAEVELVATETSRHHKPGVKFKAHKAIAEILIKKGVATAACILLMLCLCSFAKAQQQDLVSSYNLTVDTVVNSATGYLGTRIAGAKEEVTIQFVATKNSGTVGGTVSLLGSLDGINYKAATVAEGTTALPTFTATDVASQTFIWRVTKNPYLYYRVSWTGTGTMSAKFTARAVSH